LKEEKPREGQKNKILLVDMDVRSQLVFLAVFLQVLGVSSWRSYLKCPEKPNYDRCRLNLPCNPRSKNPCGCPHACCAPGKAYFISEGFSGKKRLSASIIHTLLNKISYYCVKKGECNDLCDDMSAYGRNLNRCGCGQGLKCSFSFWHGHSRCSP